MEVARYMEDGRQVDGRRGDRYIDGGMGGRVGEGVGCDLYPEFQNDENPPLGIPTGQPGIKILENSPPPPFRHPFPRFPV